MKKIKNEIVNFIKNYVNESGSKGAIVGMSGGKDSFVTAKLCVDALGSKNVFGVILPDGNMSDLEISIYECEFLNINYKVVDISEINGLILNKTKEVVGSKNLSTVSTLNTPPRIRMTILYSIAGSLGYLVANTSNLSETMIGYTTKWGDSIGDFAPIADLTKTEVCELGLELGLPKEFVFKTPEDGLSGKTDEEKIGFSYAELDDYIRFGKIGENFEKIKKMFSSSNHKRTLPAKYISNKDNYFYKR